MTQKYLYVRRDLYEQNPAKKLHTNRSFTDMAKMFKWLQWGSLGSMLSLATVILLSIFIDFTPWATVICIAIFLAIAMMTELLREKYLYHEPARNLEIAQVREQYQQYISEVWAVLENQDVNSPEKILKLRQECEASLKAHMDQFNMVGHKTYDLLIGVPLGALISSLIYADKDTAFVMIVAIVVIGIAIIGGIKIFGLIRFYTDGYFKDRYLLDALDELEYSSRV